jgi:periplasmic divalent cation tolerance protein
MNRTRFCVVLVTAPDLKTARKLAAFILRDRLAACVNLVPKIESHYWWQGKLEKGVEVLLVIKTTGAKLRALEKNVITNHPYDTPEFVVLPITSGSRRYLDWLASETK